MYPFAFVIILLLSVLLWVAIWWFLPWWIALPLALLAYAGFGRRSQ